PFEVQIRTEEMHRLAEEGIAAHWKYKEGRVDDAATGKEDQYIRWLRQLVESQQDVRDPQEFLQSLKVELYPEEVYVFTPKGEVKVLPRGATPVDVAYMVHTDVGHQCVGARINGKMAPLRTKLKNGDMVEIMTAAGHKPSRDWLTFVVTSRARNKIKHFIHSEEKTRAVELGKRVFEKEVRRFAVDKVRTGADALTAIAPDFGATKVDDLYASIRYGKVSAKQVLTRLAGTDALEERAAETGLTAVVKRVLGTSSG